MILLQAVFPKTGFTAIKPSFQHTQIISIFDSQGVLVFALQEYLKAQGLNVTEDEIRKALDITTVPPVTTLAVTTTPAQAGCFVSTRSFGLGKVE